jgi:hypothetical protein
MIRQATKMHKLNINITNVLNNYLTYVLYTKLISNISDLHFAYFDYDDDPELEELEYKNYENVKNYEKLQENILLSIKNSSKEIQNNLKKLLIIKYYIEVYNSYTSYGIDYTNEIAKILVKIFKYYHIVSFSYFKYFSDSEYKSNKTINRYIEYFEYYFVNKKDIWKNLNIDSWIYPEL